MTADFSAAKIQDLCLPQTAAEGTKLLTADSDDESAFSSRLLHLIAFSSLSDQAAEIGGVDAGEGEGAEEAREGGDAEREASCAAAVRPVRAGPAGMCRSLQRD